MLVKLCGLISRQLSYRGTKENETAWNAKACAPTIMNSTLWAVKQLMRSWKSRLSSLSIRGRDSGQDLNPLPAGPRKIFAALNLFHFLKRREKSDIAIPAHCQFYLADSGGRPNNISTLPFPDGGN